MNRFFLLACACLLAINAFGQKKLAYAGLQSAHQHGTAAYDDIRQANELMQRVMHAPNSNEAQNFARKTKAVVERAAQRATTAQAEAAAAESKAANFQCAIGKSKANAAELSFSKAAIAFKQTAELLNRISTVKDNDEFDPYVAKIKKLLEDGTKQLDGGFQSLNAAVDALNGCK